MLRESDPRSKSRSLTDWFKDKPTEIRNNFDHFVEQYKTIGNITVRGAKNMIVISTERKGIAYMVPRKSFIDIVFPLTMLTGIHFVFTRSHKALPVRKNSTITSDSWQRKMLIKK